MGSGRLRDSGTLKAGGYERNGWWRKWCWRRWRRPVVWRWLRLELYRPTNRLCAAIHSCSSEVNATASVPPVHSLAGHVRDLAREQIASAIIIHQVIGPRKTSPRLAHGE